MTKHFCDHCGCEFGTGSFGTAVALYDDWPVGARDYDIQRDRSLSKPESVRCVLCAGCTNALHVWLNVGEPHEVGIG